jgi:hypothetical protein
MLSKLLPSTRERERERKQDKRVREGEKRESHTPERTFSEKERIFASTAFTSGMTSTANQSAEMPQPQKKARSIFTFAVHVNRCIRAVAESDVEHCTVLRHVYLFAVEHHLGESLDLKG